MDIVVTRDDRRSFLEKVVAHGIDQGYLTQERRRGLQQECAALSVSLCQRLGMNTSDLAETLLAAKIVGNLLGIALEQESQGNVALASIALARSAVDLVKPVLDLVEQKEQQVENFYRRSWSRCEVNYEAGDGTRQFSFFVQVWKIEPRQEINLESNRDLASFQYYIRQRLAGFQTARDLATWLDNVADVEEEFRVSQKFLPWKQLTEEAGLRSVAALEVADMRDFCIHPRNESQMTWSPNTLLASMTVTLVHGGTYRRVGTVVHKTALSMMKQSMHKPAYFRQRGQEAFEKYLDDTLSRQPDFDAAARAYLMRMWQRAMDKLLFISPTVNSARHFNLLTWADRLHLEVSGNTLQNIALRGTGKQRRSTRIRAVDKIRALGVGPEPRRLVALVRNIRWTYVSKEEFVELLGLIPPSIFTRYAPVNSDLVILLVKHWDGGDKALQWFTEDKRNFIQRLLDESYSSFWKTCPVETLDALIQVDPDEASRLRREIARYNKPTED